MSHHSTPGEEPQRKGFAASLLDVNFHHYVTPRVVSVLYALVLIVAVLEAVVLLVGGLTEILTAFSTIGVLQGLLWLVAAVLLPIITVTFYRVLLEFFVVQFRILDAIRDLRR